MAGSLCARQARGTGGGREMAVPTRVAAALTGATIGQLVYWRIGRGVYEPMLVPEYRAGKEWLYSFRDLIALRTVVYLRERVSLQKIREATRTLERIGDADHLSKLRALRTRRQRRVGASRWRPRRSRRPTGQLRAYAVMSDVFGPFRTDKGALVIPFREPFPHIEVDPSFAADIRWWRNHACPTTWSPAWSAMACRLTRSARSIHRSMLMGPETRCEWRTTWTGEPAPPEVVHGAHTS